MSLQMELDDLQRKKGAKTMVVQMLGCSSSLIDDDAHVFHN